MRLLPGVPGIEESLDEMELGEPWNESDKDCGACGEMLNYTDEVFVLEIVEAVAECGALYIEPCVSDDGEYLYEPYFVHLECWEEALEAMREATQDIPPFEDVEGVVAAQCCVCKGRIVNYEPHITATFGEIVVSRRTPNMQATSSFMRMDSPKAICFPCISFVIEEHFDAWEDILELHPDYEDKEDDDES